MSCHEARSPVGKAGRPTRVWLPILAAIGIAAAGAAAAEPALQHVVNVRFGFSLDLPAALIAEPPPDNGDGQAFHAPDDSLRVTVSGVNNVLDQSLSAFVASDRTACLRQPPEYLLERPDRIVFSCTTGGDIVYQKTVRRGRGLDAAFVSLRIRYPARDKARWQEAVVTAANTLRLLRTTARND